MSDESLMRMKEINNLIQDGLLPFERVRILLEELLELRINYDLKHQQMLICEYCHHLKNACFFEKENDDTFHKTCRYCRLVKAEIIRKQTKIYHCPTCHTDLKIRYAGQEKFVLRKHNKTKKHLKHSIN